MSHKDITSRILDDKKDKIRALKELDGLTVEDVIVLFAYTEAIVETLRQPLIILDSKFCVKTANKAFFDTFKVNEKGTYETPIFEIGNGQWNIPALKTQLKKVLPKKKAFNDFEVTHTFDDIGEKVMLLNGRQLVLKGRETQLIFLAIEDITLRKKLDEQKDDFIGIASHELKTPLTSIKAYAQTQKKYNQKKQDSKNISISEKIIFQVRTMEQTISSFTKAHITQAGKLELFKEHFLVEELIGEVLEVAKETTVTHSIKYKGDAAVRVYADREKIRQALTNLISNAVKYSPEANEVIIETTKDDKWVTISVQDFGPGIPKDEQGMIFEKFSRIQQKREAKEIKGRGLGLYLSSEIVKVHKGKIWVESVEGEGSKFFISLPLAKK